MKKRPTIPAFIKLVVLLFIVAVNAIWPLAYLHRQATIKDEQATIIQQSGKENYQTIYLTDTEASKFYISDENELIIKGAMYDVVSYKKEGARYAFLVIFDKKETVLTSYFSGYSQLKNQLPDKKLCSFFLFYFSNFIQTGNGINERNNGCITGFTHFGTSTGYIDTASPPPKC